MSLCTEFGARNDRGRQVQNNKIGGCTSDREYFAMLRALLSNIKAIAKHNRPVNPSKSPFFDQTWGKAAGFTKNSDRADYATVTLKDKGSAAQIHDQILVMHKTPSNFQRRQFLNLITYDSVGFLSEQRAAREKAALAERLCRASVASMIEHVFEILRAYAYQLNDAVGYSPLHLAATNPQSVTEVTKYDKMRNPLETITHYRARLSSSRYSLVLRGDEKGVEFYLLPVSCALGLSKQELNYTPVFTLRASLRQDQVLWESADKTRITDSQVESICMDMFHCLIEQTKEQIRAEESEVSVCQRRGA